MAASEPGCMPDHDGGLYGGWGVEHANRENKAMVLMVETSHTGC